MHNQDSEHPFQQFGFNDHIIRALSELGFESPTPIQEQGIPALLSGRDLFGQAQTGTGKTAAFALPILNRINLQNPKPQALVLAPTRELAIQVAEAFQSFARHMKNFHVVPVYGGASFENQLARLRRPTHVIVGTAGRILDHLRRGTLSFAEVTTVVLDEADEMLRMGFIEDVESILKQAAAQKQIALFSATIPSEIRRLAGNYLTNPLEIKIASRTLTIPSITQEYWLVSGISKLEALTRFLEAEDFDSILIFVRTRVESAELAEKLSARGFSATALNGDLNQASRERVVENLKNGKLDIVIATDVAARGLDIERISHVVNFDIPNDPESYIHRIGRTGRAGRKGKAILFVTPRERRLLSMIEKVTRQTVTEIQLPSSKTILDKRVTAFGEKLKEISVNPRITRFIPIIQKMAADLGMEYVDLAAALLYQWQANKPFVFPDEETAEARPRRNSPSEYRGDNPRGKFGAASSDRPGRSGYAREDKPARGGYPRDDKPKRDSFVPRPPRAENHETAASAARPKKRPVGDQAFPVPAPGSGGEAKKKPDFAKAGGEMYRFAVGKTDGISARDVVGALANEAGVPGAQIGEIKVFNDYCMVALPPGLGDKQLREMELILLRTRTHAANNPPAEKKKKSAKKSNSDTRRR